MPISPVVNNLRSGAEKIFAPQMGTLSSVAAGWWGCAPLPGSSASLSIGHRCPTTPVVDRGLTEVLTSPNKALVHA